MKSFLKLGFLIIMRKYVKTDLKKLKSMNSETVAVAKPRHQSQIPDLLCRYLHVPSQQWEHQNSV